MKGAKSSPPKKIVKGGKKQPQKIRTAKLELENPFQMDKSMKRHVFLYGCAFFLIEYILAVVYYRERMFLDASYYIYHPIQSGWFRVDHQRFTLAFTEILPLIGSYLGLPLKALLILYSLDHITIFFILFLIIYLRNDFNGVLALTALLVFNVTYLYITPMHEVVYGAGFAVLLFSLMQNKTFTVQNYIWIALVELTVLFSHPENFALVAFFAALDIHKRKAFTRVHIMMLIILVIAARYKYVTLDSYEGTKFGGDIHGAKSTHYLDLMFGENGKNLALLMLRYYWVMLLFITTSCINYFLSCKYLRGAMVFFAFTGAIIFLDSADASNSVYSYHGSIMYTPIITIAIIPFFYDTFNSLKGQVKTIAFALVVVLVGVRFYTLTNELAPYVKRVNQMERIISACDKAGGDKFILNSNNFVKPYSEVSWSLPIETLLLSAERGKDECRSVIRYEDINDQSKVILSDTNAFMVSYMDVINKKELNPRYFHIGGGVYKALDYKE